jgi:hypothetical protein
LYPVEGGDVHEVMPKSERKRERMWFSIRLVQASVRSQSRKSGAWSEVARVSVSVAAADFFDIGIWRWGAQPG